jgi:hypothetical protein
MIQRHLPGIRKLSTCLINAVSIVHLDSDANLAWHLSDFATNQACISNPARSLRCRSGTWLLHS